MAKENMSAVEEAVRKKFKKEPRLVMRLREEEDRRVFYRAFWEDNSPSTVVVAVWDLHPTKGKWIKFIHEAYAPMKDGVPLGNQ